MNFILVIDDEESIRELLENFLTKLGYRVHVAKDGREGIRLLNRDCKYGAVITDIGMPEINGNDIVRHIRNSETPHTPVLAITGLGALDSQSNLFDMVIQKPFNLKKIQIALQSLTR